MEEREARMAMEGKRRTSSAAQTRENGVPTVGGSDTREARRLASSMVKFDLDQELSRLRQEGDYGINGRNARTLAKENELRIVLVAAKDGIEIGDGEADGALSLQVVRGHGRFTSGSVGDRLAEGQMAIVGAGEPWSFTADEDSGFLLTLSYDAGF